MRIGKKIRELRKARKMKLIELAEISGVQIASLSRMEHERMTGTLQSHMRIAQALGIDITELYKDIKDASSAVSPAAADSSTETFTYNDKASYEMLASRILFKKMMPVILRIEPGGKTTPEQNPVGSEKFIFALEGSVTVYIEKTAFPLSKNKTLYFDASRKHYHENTGKKTARLISVVTPVSL